MSLPAVLFLAFLPISITSFGQRYQIEGTVRDSETRQPIVAADIILKDSSRGTSTDDKGGFRFELSGFPAVLYIQCMGYLRDTVVIENETEFAASFKNQNRIILLKRNPIQIDEVRITAWSALFEKDPYAIIDYKIVGNQIVAMGYRNGNSIKREVLLADISGKMISNYNYKYLDSLYQDCQGNVFAFCSDSVLEFELKHKEIAVHNGYTKSFIEDLVMPVCGVADSLIFLKKSSANHQYDNYFTVHDSQLVVWIYSTGDMKKESKAATLFETWKRQAGVPASIGSTPGGIGPAMQEFLKMFEGLYHSYFNSQFTLQTAYRPIFTKMIPLGKNHLIFDREAATVFWLNDKGEVTREAGMNNKLNGLYYHDVHLDTGTGRIFIEYPLGPFTHFIEINPENGLEIRRFMIRDFKHIEKCRFLNGRLYFLYQPDTGKRIKKLYSIWI